MTPAKNTYNTSQKTLKIMIVDDHPIVISGYRALYSPQELPRIVEAHSAAEAIELYRQVKPDACVVDINLPDESGFTVARRIRQIDSSANILIFTMCDGAALALQARDCGALGFVSKTDDPLKIKEAVATVAAGKMWFTDEILQEMTMLQTDHDGEMALSGRQIEILRLLGRGRSLSEISSSVGMSYKTIVVDCSVLRERFGARTNGELVRIATEHKLV